MTDRTRVLAAVADAIDRVGSGRLLVGVDGIDGVGKTVFADALRLTFGGRRRAVVRVGLDGFLAPRSVRYARGRGSAEGYYRDSHDLAAFRSAVVDPVRAARRGPGDGPAVVRTAVLDHRTDSPVRPVPVLVPAGAVVLVDGTFLHRPELADVWDLTIWLDAPVEVAVARMAARDGSPPAVDDPWNWRYVEGQRLYVAQCAPLSAADIVVDNSDVDHPVLVRDQGGTRGVPDAAPGPERAE